MKVAKMADGRGSRPASAEFVTDHRRRAVHRHRHHQPAVAASVEWSAQLGCHHRSGWAGAAWVTAEVAMSWVGAVQAWSSLVVGVSRLPAVRASPRVEQAQRASAWTECSAPSSMVVA